MAVMKVIEILAESPDSWEDATRQAVVKASESVKNIRSVYVQEMSTTVKDGQVHMFRVNVKITFMVE
jgi:flavin-binding protein dodecin